jgi:hypothetical protein
MSVSVSVSVFLCVYARMCVCVQQSGDDNSNLQHTELNLLDIVHAFAHPRVVQVCVCIVCVLCAYCVLSRCVNVL